MPLLAGVAPEAGLLIVGRAVRAKLYRPLPQHIRFSYQFYD